MKTIRYLFYICLILFFTSCKQVKTVESFKAMNTFMTVTVFSNNPKKAEQAINGLKIKVNEIEDVFSTTRENSDVYKINNGLEYGFNNEMLKEVLDFSKTIYRKSSGAFNPGMYPIIKEWGFTTEEYKVPSKTKIEELLKYTDFSKVEYSGLPEGMQLDFGAIAKGYAGDKAIEILKECGITSAILDFGGNIQTLGLKSDDSLWKVGIRNPWNNGAACALKVKETAVVTSGGYERFFEDENGNRYIHIFDPETGYPSTSDIESVTIVCPNGMYADALTTSLFVMGTKKAVNFWKENPDFDFVILTKKHELIFSRNLEQSLEPLISFDCIECISAFDL